VGIEGNNKGVVGGRKGDQEHRNDLHIGGLVLVQTAKLLRKVS
jgi:hypothetical protein